MQQNPLPSLPSIPSMATSAAGSAAAAPPPRATLADLPPELLGEIACFLTPRAALELRTVATFLAAAIPEHLPRACVFPCAHALRIRSNIVTELLQARLEANTFLAEAASALLHTSTAAAAAPQRRSDDDTAPDGGRRDLRPPLYAWCAAGAAKLQVWEPQQLEAALALMGLGILPVRHLTVAVAAPEVWLAAAARDDPPLRAPALETLDFDMARLGPSGAGAVAQALDIFPGLRRLWMNSSDMTGEGAGALSQALGACRRLEELHLGDNFISASWGLMGLISVLPELPALRVLYLNNNAMMEAGACALADVLPRCPRLSELHLSSNDIGDAGTAALAAAAARSPAVTALLLGDNGIGTAGAVGVATSGACSTLTRLHLSFNAGIGDEGAAALARALATSASLRGLGLIAVGAGPEAAAAFAAAVQTNTSLEFLDLSYNDLGMYGKGALQLACRGRVKVFNC